MELMKKIYFRNSADNSDEKRWADRFLGDLLEKPPVKGSGLERIFHNIAKRAYFSTIDDYDFTPEEIGLMGLRNVWDERPETREAIVYGLDKFFYNSRSNLFIKAYVKKFAEKIGLDARYKI